MAISLYTVFRIVVFLNMVRRKSQMRLRLEELHQIMYSRNFQFFNVENELSSEFYQFPLKEFEVELLTRYFSVDMSQSAENGDCSICYQALRNGETVINMPGCNHKFHSDCLQLWVRTQHSCPCCRSTIRKQMLEHFHGTLEIPKEGRKMAKPDQEIITQIISNMASAKFKKQLGTVDKC